MVDSDKDKKYVYIEDNGDGTTTLTINVPEADICQTVVFSMDFDQMFEMVVPEITPEVVKIVEEMGINVPNSPEDFVV